ncbi:MULTISPECIES: DUF6745 domain-containing protein [Kamptonema]|uniref:DUF6745 domain-containing protein n=1 Tax=Kamptonema TaxID=1501433 RepID=UPI0001DAC886|nr:MULTISPECIES: hypothetical protein [Kamptonema]CBN57422.1 conserved hypothetical protein [Kamptonema sp. PCC 6506]
MIFESVIQSIIKKLKLEQESLFSVHSEQWKLNSEKWRAIALSTDRIDRDKAREVVRETYALIKRPEPKILFSDSPSRVIETFYQSGLNSLGYKLDREIDIGLIQPLTNSLVRSSHRYLLSSTRKLWNHHSSQFSRQMLREPGLQTVTSIDPGEWLDYVQVFDLCYSSLNCSCDLRLWNIFQGLVKNCAWIYPFENACIICDRPTKLSFDSESELHAEGEPAVELADGYRFYSYHGVTLPEKYGKLHPQQWQAQWLLEEYNAELRRVLIQNIGYSRIAQELQAKQLDTWQEYALLKIDCADVEPLYLLKMTCPSTRFIHALRVPPDVRSAREAIRWVNWGTDPEEFSVQT